MVIPVGDRTPTRRRPWVTWLLLLTNVGVFVFLQPWWADDCTQHEFFLNWATVPAELARGEPLDAPQVEAATPAGCDIDPAEDKSVYAAMLYSMFLHAGWLHLLFNMLYLAIFGNNVEDRLGHLRYLAFYLLTGAVATVAFVVPNLDSARTLVGASGAIAGVLGAYLLLFPGARITVLVPFLLFLPVQLPAVLVLGLWFFMQVQGVRFATMAGGGVAYLAHVAGFVAGLVIVFLLGYRPRRARRR